MCILHKHLQALFDRDVDHLALLIFCSDRQGAHAHIGRAADCRVLLDQYDIRAILCCLYRCGKSCRSACNYYNLSLKICHMLSFFPRYSRILVLTVPFSFNRPPSFC